MKPVIRKYAFATLTDYFDAQKAGETVTAAPGRATDRDTYARMAERHRVSTMQIFRIATGLSDPSFALAVAISKEVNVPADGMGMSDGQRKKTRKRRAELG